MGIPESQFQRWANRGAVTTAKKTHASIRNALALHEWPGNLDHEVYLQGSYRNATNIRGDSDVDIVVQIHNPWRSDLSDLSAYELELCQKSVVTASYDWGGLLGGCPQCPGVLLRHR